MGTPIRSHVKSRCDETVQMDCGPGEVEDGHLYALFSVYERASNPESRPRLSMASKVGHVSKNCSQFYFMQVPCCRLMRTQSFTGIIQCTTGRAIFVMLVCIWAQILRRLHNLIAISHIGLRKNTQAAHKEQPFRRSPGKRRQIWESCM